MREFGRYDYVIVGAGSAGCLLANRLSKDPSIRVLLLEAGGKDDYFWIPIPVGYLYTIANPRTDWCYKTEPDEYLAGRSIHYARGRVLGGCSSINARIGTTGPRLATAAGAGTRSCRSSRVWRITSAAPPMATVRAAKCASKIRACAGTSSMRGARRRRNVGFRRSESSITATTSAARTSR